MAFWEVEKIMKKRHPDHEDPKCKLCKRFNTCGVCGNKYPKALYCEVCRRVRNTVLERIKQIPDGTYTDIWL